MLKIDGDKIKRLRDARGWRLRDLSLRSGVSEAAINRYERNRVGRPNFETLGKIAEALEEPLSTFVQGDQVEPSADEHKMMSDLVDLHSAIGRFLARYGHLGRAANGVCFDALRELCSA